MKQVLRAAFLANLMLLVSAVQLAAKHLGESLRGVRRSIQAATDPGESRRRLRRRALEFLDQRRVGAA